MAPSTRIKRSSTGRTRTAPEPISDSLPPQSIVKDEPGSPDQDATARAGPSYTTLRCSTRSSTSLALHLSSYAYSPVNGTTSAPATPPRKRIKVEPKPSTPLARTSEGAPTPRSSSKKMPVLALDKPHKEPERWREQYRLIEKMRRGIIAPVDDMGCERPRTTTDADRKTLRFHILISLMLSSQTKDPVTSAAVTNLHQTLPGGLNAQSLAEASVEVVHECINKVGFWRRKTEYIQDAARKLLEQPGEERGDVPRTLEGLCELKGVGPKMAFLCLQCAWDINAGIGVDVHVHRITNRLRWHKPQTTNPEQTRLNLQSWLPPELHKPINPMMVICLPVGPRCDHCLLAKARICPSRVTNVKAEGRKEVVYTFTDSDDESGKPKVEVGYEQDTAVKMEIPDSPLRPLKGEEVDRVVSGTPAVKREVEEPGLGQEGVLDLLDQVDGSKEIAA